MTENTAKSWLETHGWEPAGQSEWRKKLRTLKSTCDADARIYCDGDAWQLVITADDHILFNLRLPDKCKYGYVGGMHGVINWAEGSMDLGTHPLFAWASGYDLGSETVVTGYSGEHHPALI